MVKRNNIFFFVITIFIGFACGNVNSTKPNVVSNQKKLSYATCFKIYDFKTYQLIEILNQQQTISNYVLYKNEKPQLKIKDAIYVKTPVSKIAALSSIYIGFLKQLKVLSKIMAIDNYNYVFNDSIQLEVKQNKIKEIAINGQINEELAIQLKPDIIFTYFDPSTVTSKNQKLNQVGIPIMSLVDHLEQHPLGRAEWIKFFACFLGNEKFADSLFLVTEKKYNDLKRIAATSKIKPKVLTEHKLNDAWYLPAGKSYMATLLKDANTNYFLENSEQTGSLPLSFEDVYSKSVDADYWLNVLFCKTKTDLLKLDIRYGDFKAFQNNHVYNNDLLVTHKGANDYWETGLTQPDLILNDMIVILHPELNLNHQLRFYQKLK